MKGSSILPADARALYPSLLASFKRHPACGCSESSPPPLTFPESVVYFAENQQVFAILSRYPERPPFRYRSPHQRYAFMRSIPTFCLICLLFLSFSLPASGNDGTDKGNLPEHVEKALSSLLSDTPRGRPDPTTETLDTILDFVTTNKLASSRVRPEKRAQGQGAYLQERLNVPLKKIIAYTLNPEIPGEVVYPAVVRRNAWLPGSEILSRGKELLASSLPPVTVLSVRGTEFEETTPDVSSGCYYTYQLDRLFVLAAHNGRTALFSISVMPRESDVGKKGAIVGKETDWTHVYSGVPGTNITMLGWAETHLYGSASVSVYLENGSSTDVYMFKWAKGGWAGSNVIKPSHLTAGLKRFTASMGQILENPATPEPEAIASEFKKLSGLSDAELRAQLAGFARYLSKQPDKLLKEKEFAAVLANNDYAQTLSRDNMIAELMKLFMRKHLGTLPQEVATTLM